MKKANLVSIFFLLSILAPALAVALDIPLDAPWKEKVTTFSRTELQHTAWGFSHCQRDFLVSHDIATRENLPVDNDVLFAAAFLHDMGGFAPYAQPGVDHALRSTQVVESVLGPAGFPMAKLDAVKEAILTHSYYSTLAPRTPEAIALHDADTLDFLGDISIARILSLTTREAVAKDLVGASRTLHQLLAQAPGALVTTSAKKLGAPRVAEMRAFLAALDQESFGEGAL